MTVVDDQRRTKKDFVMPNAINQQMSHINVQISFHASGKSIREKGLTFGSRFEGTVSHGGKCGSW